ncbi:MAG: hypothetical protein LBG45_00680 [Dysgonamonadaceae bacterium]|nr:hypothetical protein [Dysgonamonadaceae bacterium]
MVQIPYPGLYRRYLTGNACMFSFAGAGLIFPPPVMQCKDTQLRPNRTRQFEIHPCMWIIAVMFSC